MCTLSFVQILLSMQWIEAPKTGLNPATFSGAFWGNGMWFSLCLLVCVYLCVCVCVCVCMKRSQRKLELRWGVSLHALSLRLWINGKDINMFAPMQHLPRSIGTNIYGYAHICGQNRHCVTSRRNILNINCRVLTLLEASDSSPLITQFNVLVLWANQLPIL